MRITTSSKHDTVSLTIRGRFDFNARHEFKPAIQECYDSKKHNIILDLGGVTFIDSAGLALIHRCIMDSQTQNVNVTLANPKQQVHDILELCNMNHYISSPTVALAPEHSDSASSNVLTKDALSIID